MNPERFQQIRNLFEAALEKPIKERFVFLDQASQGDEPLRHEIKRMLAAHEQTVTFLNGAVTAPAALRTDPLRMEGRRLGPFEILREIGRGGMGTVYLARRVDELFHQQVAIKFVTPETAGEEVIERFYQEREILASLQHPNIARIYDGGTTEEGWPYFVMEYIEGKPIDAWCDDRKLNVSDRLRLFQTICAAVHYAHQHRVIHRDLKPGNILVTDDGVVKLLDFGIAKLVRAGHNDPALMTREGMRLMTPEYASPEQIRAEETTPSTDIYSLGVILYQLLTGRQPYRLKSRIFHEIVRVICEEPPQRPSTAVMEIDQRPTNNGKTLSIPPGLLSNLREGTPVDLKRRLAGDLDNVLLKALEKDSVRRYRNVEQFRMDLERHLDGQAVLARKNTWWMRVGRLIEGHRVALALGVAILIAIVTGGIRIEWTGAADLGVVLALLAMWHAATDPKLSSKLAEHFSVIAVFLSIAGLGLLVSASRSFPLLEPWLGNAWLVSCVMLAAIGYCWARLVGWFFRSRWAGGLILKVKVGDRLLVVFWMNAVQVASTIARLVRDHSRGTAVEASEVIFVVMALSLALLIELTARFLEIRDKGLIFRGRLITWVNIEGYAWEGSNEPGALAPLRLNTAPREVVRLDVRRFFRILPPPRIPIPSEAQAKVEAIMSRHLSEWPKQMSNTSVPTDH